MFFCVLFAILFANAIPNKLQCCLAQKSETLVAYIKKNRKRNSRPLSRTHKSSHYVESKKDTALYFVLFQANLSAFQRNCRLVQTMQYVLMCPYKFH